MKELNKELLGSLVVLYIEDEDFIRDEVSYFLGNQVKELIVAKDGIEAIEKFKEYEPDLLITDLQMPKMNGIEMLEKLNNKNVPVIVTTAYSDVEYFLKAIELRVNKFIIKPIDLYQLMHDIQDCILSTHLRDRLFEKEQLLNIVDENVLVSVTDKNGVIIDASSAFCDFVEYSREELIGATHRILKHPDTPNSFYEQMWKEIISGKVFKTEIRNRKKSGKEYWAKLTITPVIKNGEVVNYTAIRQDITNKKKLEKLSIEDELTTLYNRRYFNKVMDREIRRVKRDNSSLSLLTFDIDFFKKYNDTYGHPEGDEVLRKVAKKLKECTLRSTDYVFRTGGEEFAVLFSSKNKEEAYDYACSIVNKVEDMKIIHEQSLVSDYLTISGGLIVQKAEDVVDEKTIYKLSDEALYEAKQNGRNQVVLSKESK